MHCTVHLGDACSSWNSYFLVNMSSLLDSFVRGDDGISDRMVGSFDYDYDYSKGSHGYSDSASDRHSGYGGDYGGYGSHSGYGQKEACCPLVVDFLCLAAILGAIAGATLLLQRVFQIELTMLAGRRKRSAEFLPLLEGEHATISPQDGWPIFVIFALTWCEP